MNTMGSYKAPSLDGFQLIFFKTYWDIVGDRVFEMVKKAFLTGDFEDELAVVLIPKE